MLPIKNFFKSIKNMPEIIEYYHITGKADFFLKSATKDIPNYENLILYLLATWQL